jgi:hypothetical protein
MAGPTPLRQPRTSVAGDTLIHRLPKKAFGAAFGAVVAGLVLTAGQAKALVLDVSVRGLNYQVSTFIGSYPDNISKFATTADGGLMPWWGSRDLADRFASGVGIRSLDWVQNFGANYGPFFGYEYATYSNPLAGGGISAASATFSGIPGSILNDGTINSWRNVFVSDSMINSRTQYTWAQATLIVPTGGGSTSGGTASVPGPLPILGLAAAFGFSRKLRERMKR